LAGILQQGLAKIYFMKIAEYIGRLGALQSYFGDIISGQPVSLLLFKIGYLIQVHDFSGKMNLIMQVDDNINVIILPDDNS
jgi:hypothetical protein